MTKSHVFQCAFVGALFLSCGAVSHEAAESSVENGSAAFRPFWGSNIVFYNVENLFDTLNDARTNDDDFTPSSAMAWTSDRYGTKLLHLSEALSWTGTELPALIGLCEVENEGVVVDLARTASLKDAGYLVVHHDSPDERGIDVALLVDPSRASVVGSEALTVRLHNDATRDVLYARLVLLDEQVLHVFVNHWPSRREGLEKSEPKRMAAARVVKDRIELIRAKQPNALILVMGDFNDAPTDRSIRDGLGSICERSSGKQLTALMCLDQPAGHGSYQYKGEWSYLDQFIVSRSLLDHIEQAKALWDQRLLFKHPKNGASPDKTYSGGHYKGGFSDHLPIVLRTK